MPRNTKLTPERDIPILLFLWKWKLSTTAALYLKFFGACTPKRAYNRLSELKRGGFVEAKSLENRDKTAWVLTKKGFLAIREELAPLREQGFASEHMAHDLVVSAVHQGDWFYRIPENREILTEQEVRRLSFDEFPAWAPRTDLHRPDGYWHIRDGENSITVALEVELNQKKLSNYSRATEFYSYYKNINCVLWVVPSVGKAQSILREMTRNSTESSNHDFVLLSDFYRHGWQSTMVVGPNTGKTISNLLRGNAGGGPAVTPAHPSLETRRYSHISMSYKFSATPSSVYCVAHAPFSQNPQF